MFEKEQQTPSDYLANLVGDDKKYKTVEDLAKAYANADAKIMADAVELGRKVEVETELEITKRLLEQANNRVAPIENKEAKPNTTVVAPVSDEDLEARIKRTLAEQTDGERKRINQEAAAKRLVETYGDVSKAKEAIAARASELGVSSRWLEDTAASSPNAFYVTMGLTAEQAKSTPAPKGDVNSEAFKNAQGTSHTKPGTYKYYQEIRKREPKLYASSAIQRQMHNDAIANGADFYT